MLEMNIKGLGKEIKNIFLDNIEGYVQNSFTTEYISRTIAAIRKLILFFLFHYPNLKLNQPVYHN